MTTLSQQTVYDAFIAICKARHISKVSPSLLARQFTSDVTEADVQKWCDDNPTLVSGAWTSSPLDSPAGWFISDVSEPAAVLSCETALLVNQTNPSLIVKVANDTFAAACETEANWTIGVGTSGLTFTTCTKDSATQVTLAFTGTVAAGTITILAEALALTGTVDSPILSVDVNGETVLTTTNTATVSGKTFTDAKIDDGHEGLTLDSADQTHASAKATFPDLVTSDTVMMENVAQTGTQKTFESVVLNGIVYGVEAAITLAGGDVTLSAAQLKKTILEVTTGHAANAIIAPAITGRAFIVVNNHATLPVLVKKAGGTAVTIPALSTGVVYYNGTQYACDNSQEVLLAAAQTLTNKTLEEVTVNGMLVAYTTAIVILEASTTLSASEIKNVIVNIGTAHATGKLIFPKTANKLYIVRNNDAGVDAILKCVDSLVDITVVKSTAQLLYCDGTNLIPVAL